MSNGITWQKSSFSGGGDGNACLELAAQPTGLALRESDDPVTILTTTSARLGALLSTLKKDIAWQKSSFSGGGAGNNCLELTIAPTGPALRESDDPATVLTTTPARLAALLTVLKEPIAG